MPLVSVEVGTTLKIGDPYGNNYFKATLAIKDIDTEQDLASQLADASTALKTTFNYLYEKLDKEVEARLDSKIT